MSKKIRTGFFSGSFNPIHIGHLALANYLCEYGGLDELWFIVSPLNPLKNPENLLDESKRLDLVRAAIQGYPKFQASDVELSLPRPSYTIRTLDHLKEEHPEREFVLIIGSDNWNSFGKWKEAERLTAENPILIYPRPGFPIDPASLSPTVRSIDAPLLDISSTFIREAFREGKNMKFFLHPETYERIRKEGLYCKRRPTASKDGQRSET